MSNRVGACEGELTGLKAMAEEMLGYLKPSEGAKEVAIVQADESNRPAYVPRDRRLCDYCGRGGHEKSRCFLDPAGEYYRPEYAKFINERAKKEKKNYNNLSRRKVSRQRCNDSSETSEEESDDEERRSKKTERVKQKVNFANMVLQAMMKDTRPSKGQSSSQRKGPTEASSLVESLGRKFRSRLEKLFPKGKFGTAVATDKETAGVPVDDERTDEMTARHCLALARREIPPQLNCVPHRLRDRIIPRRKVLPKICANIEDSAKAWTELRKLSQIAAARNGNNRGGSDSGFQTVESDEEPQSLLRIAAHHPESALWTSRQREFNDETSTEDRTIFQCLFEPAGEIGQSNLP
ncbi:MAG: hypothetical protein GY696_10465, partial [Gammaproteobacteria bacterium]|nr:hypothetical protein [Gammaproteobacteria bacterium]